MVIFVKTFTVNKLVFQTVDEARNYYRLKTSYTYNSFLKGKGFDAATVDNDDIDSLKEKLNKIDSFLNDENFIKKKTHIFTSRYHFRVLSTNSNSITITYSISHILQAAKDYMQEKLNQLEQSTTFESIKQLIEELPENEIKNNLITEIEELEAKKEDLLNIKFEERARISDLMQLGQHKADIFAKRSDVFLKFLDRESIASMIGSVLLLLMGICLIIMMFLQKEPIKIVESAFLLILGYFFGHSKNNK